MNHATHLKNLEAILVDGEIRPGAEPEFDVASPELRARRAQVEVVPGEPLTSFVPFSLSPDATWWNEVRTGAEDPRWSNAARRAAFTEYAVLVGTVAAVGPDLIVSDGDAGAMISRFGVGVADATQLLRRRELIDPELLDAEVLVHGAYSMSDVVVLAVPNEPVRDRVRATLRDIGVPAPRLVVYPPWFQPTLDGE
jgi:hypothetical protein